MTDADGPVASAVWLDELDLRQFRTYTKLHLAVPAGIVTFVGPNGIGKTNLLEACAWSLTGSSPRTSSEARGLQSGGAFFRIAARAHVGEISHESVVTYQAGVGKKLELEGSVVQADALFATLPAVVFLPEKLLVVRGAPTRRRAVLDRLVSRLDRRAVAVQRSYVRAITQRNTLLRRAKRGSGVSEQLLPWTEQVASFGEQIRFLRAEAVSALSGPFRERFEQLTGLVSGRLEMTLRGSDLRTDLEAQLPTDIRRGTTSAGPHLDDLRFLDGDRDLREFGSTGEQRAALLAWALAEHDATVQATGIRPLVLLDEPYAELDAGRRARLTQTLATLHQVIVTSTEPPASLLELQGEVTLLSISSGEVNPWHAGNENQPAQSRS